MTLANQPGLSSIARFARAAIVLAGAGLAALHLFPAGWDLLYAARADRLDTMGKVERTSGQVPVTPGQFCWFIIDPNFKAGYNCRLELTCGAVALWGGRLRGGYADCEAEHGAFVHGENRDVTDWGGQVSMVFDLDRQLVLWWSQDGEIDVHLKERP